MKLLFDENLSPKLVERLADVFPGSVHVDRIGLGTVSDEDIWKHAKMAGYMIVSKDSDFHEKSLFLGYPPKVVWIRCGNCATSEIEVILRRHVEDIERLASDSELAYLILL